MTEEKTKKDNPELYNKIEVFLKDEVNPAISAHGGSINLEKVEGTIVYVSMAGGCRGCAMANETLRMGVEVKMKEKFPEVTELVDVTNHAGGDKPFFGSGCH